MSGRWLRWLASLIGDRREDEDEMVGHPKPKPSLSSILSFDAARNAAVIFGAISMSKRDNLT